MSKALEMLALQIDDAGDYAEEGRIIDGFRAGLKRAAEKIEPLFDRLIASGELEHMTDTEVMVTIEQAILKEAND